MQCAERSGFLFAHGCDRPAGAKCSQCQKDVCSLHIGNGLCTTCQKQAAAAGAGGAGLAGRRAAREDDPYFYADTYYDDYHYYDDSDQAVFDASAAEAGDAAFEGDFEGS